MLFLVGQSHADPIRSISPTVTARVFDPRVRIRALRSTVKHRDALPDPLKPPEKKPWRPRVMPLPMGSMATGSDSKGVKLKIRF